MHSTPTADRHTVEVESRIVGYRRAGRGAPVAVLGALDRSALSTRALAEVLRARNTVLALDPPGYGASDPLDPGAGVETIADWLTAALDVLAPEGCPLVGVGSGGLVAIELARRDGRTPVILDDVPVLDAATRARVAAGYAPPNPIRADGTHVLAHWAMRRAEQLWFPWFDQTPEAALDRELAIDDLHHAVMDAVARGDRWAEPYDAMWRYAASDGDLDVTEVRALAPSSPRFGTPPGELVPAGPDPAERCAVIADEVARVASGPLPPAATAPQRAGRWTRVFAVTPWGQVAVRRHDPAGAPTSRPLVALHASPLAGASLLALARGLVGGRTVLLPDTLGNGDSPAPDPSAHPEFRRPGVEHFAAALLAALSDLGVDEFDLYGTHSGAVIAAETALLAPGRVVNLVLNGVPILDAPPTGSIDEYLVDLTPTGDATHLQRGWSNIVDVLTWYPWHARDPAHRRAVAMPDAAVLHARYAQFAAGTAGYALPFRAVHVHPTRERLAKLSTRTLLCHVPADPLAPTLAEAAAAIDGSDVVEVSADPAAQAAVIDRWLAADRSPRAPGARSSPTRAGTTYEMSMR
jgi:pimeloyl-ACP methyl ester carboxylesterase